ncbi:hypothetical protein [Bacillus sp. GM_Baccil_2]|uniref:hypothetical protein n=1 Tax=Bacillus sp. GM_Baccil_2 TaxID=2937369 RepID=UPI00226AB216
MGGNCINNTNEIILTYSTRRPQDGYPTPNETSLYYTRPGRSNEKLDTDGIYIPIDRIVRQRGLPDVKGPVAVKFASYQSFTVTQEGKYYVLDSMNWGVFKQNEYGCPSLWPLRVCWPIPSLTSIEIQKNYESVCNACYPNCP